MDYWMIGVLVIGGLLVLKLYLTYNRLMALDERCNTSFADIDVQLKHRHSVIPALCETVRATASHEKDILIAVAEARSKALSAVGSEARLEAETQLGNALNYLITVAEKYPDLKASDHFREMRVELTDIENRITASRRFFNLTVDEYNTTVRQLPGSLIGRLARLGTRKHFDLGVERVFMDEPVTVKL